MVDLETKELSRKEYKIVSQVITPELRDELTILGDEAGWDYLVLRVENAPQISVHVGVTSSVTEHCTILESEEVETDA